MQDGGLNQVHVAPLRIRKSQKDLREHADQSIRTFNTEAGRPDLEMPEAIASLPPRPKFQNFLRASYPFQPQDQFSSSSVTIPLLAGDIVLVHSIHTNGWADGTKLETGARGWLPTNYCEPYDYAYMRPLLKALTDFWDIIRNDGHQQSELYRNHDHMRGMVAGVRFLLEKSDCLTRDAQIVRTHDRLRKIRKGLLSDLSLLVKAAKTLQTAEMNHAVSHFEQVCDEILLKAFQVVTRAVAFFDLYSEEVTFADRSSGGSDKMAFELDLPASVAVDAPQNNVIYGISKRSSMLSASTNTAKPSPNSYRRSRASFTKPPTLTHRMSYTGRNILATTKSNLASEQLSDTYDAFLGVLASFLGSHMQSRSSSELLLTTQQAVKSCRKLLEVVEIILDHDMSNSVTLEQAKDFMCEKITELVHAAREVFRPLHGDDDDMIYLPSEAARLVSAATACVSGAGKCVATARILLEEIGDFELELSGHQSEPRFEFEEHPIPSESITTFEPTFTPDESAANSRRGSQQRINSVIDEPSDIRDGTNELAPHETMPNAVSLWSPPAAVTGSPKSGHSQLSTDLSSPSDLLTQQQHKALQRTTQHGSESTLVSSTRDSGPSFISQTSTRATSPDSHTKGSPCIPGEIIDEGEDALMEYQFAHELVINPDGKIIGGSLNALIERLTSHESTPDPAFVSTVFLTFRLFASSVEFASALTHRFDYVEQSPHISQTVRLRVSNTMKGWLESHWRHDRDEAAIPTISTFIRTRVQPMSATAGKKLLDLLHVVTSTHAPAVPRVLSSMGKTNTASMNSADKDAPAPAPILSKSQLNALKVWKMGGNTQGLSVTDFDPLEVARQLTIKTSSIFCSILPEELLGCEFMKETNSLAVNVRALTTFSNDLANLVIESILAPDDAKKRAAMIKHWIKVEARLLELHNYENLITINASLMSSTVQRLRKTWDLLGQKTKTTMEEIKRVVDHSKNYAALRQRIQNLGPPCLPYVGIYRTDLTFIDQGCQATRELKTADESISVINFDKHSKTAKIISDLQRFQVEYKLTPIDELQTWLQDACIKVRVAGEMTFQQQYRRSLRLEPKIIAQTPNVASKSHKFGGLLTRKEAHDFLGWGHAKDRMNSVGSS